LPSIENAQLDEGFYEMLTTFSKAADDANVPWLLVGATARVLLLEKIYGWPTGVATEDTDFAVQVENWDHYEKLCNQLAKSKIFKPLQKPTKRFSTNDKLLFDLIPYGGVETGIKQVYWPPHNDDLMTVRGFSSAHKDAITVKVNNKLDIPIISPRALCALKLFAWQERHAQHPGRDAKDIAYLFHNIESLYPAITLHEEHQDILEENDYDIQLAALHQFGNEIKELLETEDNEFLFSFLNNEVSYEQ